MSNKEDILEIQSLMMYNKDLKMELEICQQSVKEADDEIRNLKAELEICKTNHKALVSGLESILEDKK